MIAIGYARLSKTSDRSVSIEYQKDAIRKLADAQGYQLIAIEIDNGLSGKSVEARPAVKRVIEMVNSGKIDAVIVYRSDRLSRNGIEGLLLEQTFRTNNVKYWSFEEGLIANNSDEDEFFGFVRNGMNQLERRKISKRTREALALKKAKGERVGCQLPYGQTVINGNVVEVASEKEIIRRIKELRNAGMSSYKVTAAINAEGYLTRKNTAFSRTQIVRILAA
jgi:site-specific DNA recombinase